MECCSVRCILIVLLSAVAQRCSAQVNESTPLTDWTDWGCVGQGIETRQRVYSQVIVETRATEDNVGCPASQCGVTTAPADITTAAAPTDATTVDQSAPLTDWTEWSCLGQGMETRQRVYAQVVVQTRVSEDNVGCPASQFCGVTTAPTYITTAAAPADATTGNIVYVGNAPTVSTATLDTPGVIFLVNDAAKQNGIIFAFSGYFALTTELLIQIWRPTSNSYTFQLIDQMTYQSNSIGQQDVYINDIRASGCTRVLSNDRFSITDRTGALPIGYIFNTNLNAPVLYYQTGAALDIGTSVTFDALMFPYQFSFGVYVRNDDPANPPTATGGDNKVTCPSVRIPNFKPLPTISTPFI